MWKTLYVLVGLVGDEFEGRADNQDGEGWC